MMILLEESHHYAEITQTSLFHLYEDIWIFFLDWGCGSEQSLRWERPLSSASQLVAQPNSFCFFSCPAMLHYMCWGELCLFYNHIYSVNYDVVVFFRVGQYLQTVYHILECPQVHQSSGIWLNLFFCSKKHYKHTHNISAGEEVCL